MGSIGGEALGDVSIHAIAKGMASAAKKKRRSELGKEGHLSQVSLENGDGECGRGVIGKHAVCV